MASVHFDVIKIFYIHELTICIMYTIALSTTCIAANERHKYYIISVN